MLAWTCVVSLPFEENTYIAHLKGQRECLVFDPGFEPEKIREALQAAELEPVAIVNTHGHSDHIAGNAAMKAWFPTAPLVIGVDETAKLTDPQLNLSAMYGWPLVSPAADATVKAGDIYQAAHLEFEVRACPGHSPGHVVFLSRQHVPWVVIGGDVLFRGSIGRTDFPDGNHEALLTAIRQEIFTLPDDTIILPGHGPPTTVGEEKRFNPYLQD